MQVGGPGGDLQGGQDESRNAKVSALKKLFYSRSDESSGPNVGADATGLLLDLPLARWSMVMLPHLQTILNVHQPQYTLMFEELLATPEPWFYLHAYLPGGAENLANLEYSLEPGTKAPLSGTLMQVVSVERLPDARLLLIVQGLGRAVVLRGTQQLPYARADVRLLPDREALLAAARANRRWLLATVGSSEPAAVRRQMVMAAAVAEDACWRECENERAAVQLEGDSVRLPPALCTFNASADAAAAAAREQRSMEAAMQAAKQAAEAGGAAEAVVWEETGEAEEAARAYPGTDAVLAALVEATASTPCVGEAAMVAAEAEAEAEAAAAAARAAAVAAEEAEEAEEARMLEALEVQVWLELDALLRALARLRGTTAAWQQLAAAQLLALLPAPPEPGGWPEGFVLQRLGATLRERAAQGRAVAGGPEAAYDPEPYVPPPAEGYPARRRAQRLSYAVWQVIRDQAVEPEDVARQLQPVLEQPSTADRLRLALLRLRELRRRVRAATDDDS